MESSEWVDLSGIVAAPELLQLAGRSITSVSAAYKYDRKGHDTFDDVTGTRNPSYGRENDEIVCVIEFTAFSKTPLWERLKGAGDQIRRELLQAEVDAAQAKLDAAKATLEALDG